MRLSLRLLVVLIVGALSLTAAAPALAAEYDGAVPITFPAVSSARYSDDFDNPRSGGRVHRATDIFAAAGSRIVAARGGQIVWAPALEQVSAGFALQVRGDDGRIYAYYHLGPAGGRYSDAIAPGLALGDRVERGQLLGYMGDSGNSAGAAPHLHFEIHDTSVTDPYGSNRRNPYASLRAAQGQSAPATSGPSKAPGPMADGVLRLGERGPAVARWQRLLNRTRPHAPIGTDGVFGPQTEHATELFQRSVGLGPEGLGVVGPRTRAAVRRFLQNEPAGAVREPAPPARPSRPAGTAAPVLRLGDRGAAVTKWQHRLNRTRPHAPIGTDGVFGPQTEHATELFQRSVGLGPEGLGVVGPQTRAAVTRFLRDRGSGGATTAPAPSPRTSDATGQPILRLGDRGEAVARWQRALNRTRPQAPIGTDGVFGPQTEKATKLFQRSVGLGPEGLGIVGPRTRAALASWRP